MQEKEEAFLQLSTFVTEMREAYVPYLTQTMNVALAAVTSKWSDGVREVRVPVVQTLIVADSRRHASWSRAYCK